MRTDHGTIITVLDELKLTDTVFVYHQNDWIKADVVAKPYKDKIIVSGIGPAVPLKLVLTEIDFTWMKHRNELSQYTNSLKS